MNERPPSYFSLGPRLPRRVAAPLFGDRERFGLVAQRDDACWKEWEETYIDFYRQNQRASVGRIVNDAGYRVMKCVPMTNRAVLEVGPGMLSHVSFWSGIPRRYVLADIQREMLDASADVLARRGVVFEQRLMDAEAAGRLPFSDAEFDTIVSFYSLEHLYPLEQHMEEFLRVLRPGGLLVGAIPAEGGLAWGVGRMLTTRRWLRRNTGINPDKIICWEHPNFADSVLRTLDRFLEKRHMSYWPLGLPSIDLNLIVRFVYAKR